MRKNHFRTKFCRPAVSFHKNKRNKERVVLTFLNRKTLCRKLQSHDPTAVSGDVLSQNIYDGEKLLQQTHLPLKNMSLFKNTSASEPSFPGDDKKGELTLTRSRFECQSLFMEDVYKSAEKSKSPRMAKPSVHLLLHRKCILWQLALKGPSLISLLRFSHFATLV